MMDLTAELAAVLGLKGWLTGADTAGWHRDWLDRYGEAPLGVARPATTAEVSAVLRLCHRAGVHVVPQGGNTGLCGGAVLGQAGGVILSLARMSRIGAPDPLSNSIEVEAGVVLAALHQALEPTGLIFPLHLGAEGSAQIGGLIGTNAGGSHALRHGMMADLVLGVEAVLADGTVWNGLRAVQKDNAGYALRRLFCGSEGTLGVVTRAVLKLSPAPRQRATALLVCQDTVAAVRFGSMLRSRAGEFLNLLEFFTDFGLRMVERHVGLTWPLDTRGGCYLVVELASGSEMVPIDAILEDALDRAMAEGLVLDGTLAASEAQRAAFLRIREELPEGQRLEGPQLKHDISVPPGRIPDFIAEAAVICEGLLPGVRINPFGHLGDGNIHYNLSPPEAAPDFAGRETEIGLQLATLATGMGGSFAAEHGLGRSKIYLADALRPAVERDLMWGIRTAFDPAGILNPGVLVDR